NVTKDAHNSPIPRDRLLLLREIHNLPDDKSSQAFAPSLEQCLKNLGKFTNDHEQIGWESDNLFLIDTFFRRLGSIHALDTMQFQDPVSATEQFSTLFNILARYIKKDDLNIRAERRAMFFFACYGLECAFKQLPQNLRVATPDCLAMITNQPS